MMKRILLLIFVCTLSILKAQTKKVAILDFENTSGKTEYDGLGKALSNMLITDLKNNIHPKKIKFFERSQLNKILEEQNLQKSKVFDKKTAVDFGKLSGSDYVFVGSLFVLKGTCNITSRLVDVQTSEILLTQDVSGKIEDWLSLKSQLGEGIAQTMNQPLDLDGNYRTQKTNMATLNQYSKLLSTMDDGETEKAEQFRSLFEETNPEFKYFTDLKNDISELKKRLSDLEEEVVAAVENPELIAKDLIKRNVDLDRAKSMIKLFDSRNDYYVKFGPTKKIFSFLSLARIAYREGDLLTSIAYYDSVLQIDNNVLQAHFVSMYIKMGGNHARKITDKKVQVLNPQKDYTQEIIEHYKFLIEYNRSNIKSFNEAVFRSPFNRDDDCKQKGFSDIECNFFEVVTMLPKKDASAYWDFLWYDAPQLNLYDAYTPKTNDLAKFLIEKNKKSMAILILENSIEQQINFIDSLILTDENDNSFDDIFKKSKRNFDFFKERITPIRVGDLKQKYFLILEQGSVRNGYSKYLINKKYGPNQLNQFFESIILLSELYLQENKPDLGFSLLNDFRQISKKIISLEESNYFLLSHFNLNVKIMALRELCGLEVGDERKKCSEIYAELKNKFPNYIGYQNNFDDYYSRCLLSEKELYNSNNINELKRYFLKKSNISMSNNTIYRTVFELINQYSFNAENKMHVVHARLRDYSFIEEYFINISFEDGFSWSKENLEYNKMNKNAIPNLIFELEKIISNDKKVTLFINGNNHNLFGIEADWLEYSETEFSKHLNYELDDLGDLRNDKYEEVRGCINNLYNPDTYNTDLVNCTQEIGLEEVFNLFSMDAMMLNNIAWAYSNLNDVDKRDLEIANQMAKKATAIAFDTNVNLLDTYSYTLFKLGRMNESKMALEKAINILRQKEDFETLQSFEYKLSRYN